MAANAPGRAMKKLINAVEDIVPESLAGLGAAHPDLVKIDPANNVVLRAGGPKRGKVALISGRRLGPRAAARRVRRPGHAGRGLCRQRLHVAGPRPDGGRDPRRRWRRRACSTSSRTTPATS